MATNDDARLERELAELQQEYQGLRDRKLRTEQILETLGQQIKELEARAVAEYGTADPAELEKLLIEKRAGNERLVAEYREHLASIHGALAEVEAGLDGGAGD